MQCIAAFAALPWMTPGRAEVDLPFQGFTVYTWSQLQLLYQGVQLRHSSRQRSTSAALLYT